MRFQTSWFFASYLAFSEVILISILFSDLATELFLLILPK